MHSFKMHRIGTRFQVKLMHYRLAAYISAAQAEPMHLAQLIHASFLPAFILS